MTLRLKDEQYKKWLMNVLKFTAPAFAVLFYQLSQGTELKVAAPLALYVLYALIADFLKKLNN
jgi:hypothetical protein